MGAMKDEKQPDIPTAPEVKAPAKVPVVSGDTAAPEADEATVGVVDAADAEQATKPESAPEVTQPVPQLIKGAESTKKVETAAEPGEAVDAELPAEADDQATEAGPAEEQPWAETDEAGKKYDPGRGDYVDHLNDTTPPPPPAPKPKKKKGGKRWVWVLVVLLLAAAGAGAYLYFGSKKASAPEPMSTTATQSTTQKTEEEPAATVTVKTKHVDSSNFSMGLDYPENWQFKDTETLLSVTSPQMTFQTFDGKEAKGYVRLTVQPKQTSLPDFAKGAGTAVMESSKLTYKKPTQNQRAQTYLTFVGYATGNGGLEALYVTGNNGYQIRQDVLQAEVLQTDPLVTVKFLSCTTQECTGTTTPLSVKNSVWVKTPVSETVTNLIQSFSFN